MASNPPSNVSVTIETPHTALNSKHQQERRPWPRETDITLNPPRHSFPHSSKYAAQANQLADVWQDGCSVSPLSQNSPSVGLISFYSGAICCIGGPALVIWVSPTEEELFMRYNPELQRRSLETRYKTQKDFDDFVMKLREYSKSDKPSTSPARMAEGRFADGR